MVIVNYRTKELTRAAVASVLSEAEVRQVVVVDNASGDDSASFLRAAFNDARVRVIESPRNGGFGAGVNLGAAACTAPLLFILNSDATVRPGCIGLLAEALLADDALGVVAPAIFREDGQTPEPGTFGPLPSRHQLVLGAFGPGARRPVEPEWVSGVAMLLRRSDFVEICGFDEAFSMYFEDMDLCRRLRDRGKLVRREPAAVVIHAGGGSWHSSAEKRRRFHDSKAVYYERIGATPLELRCIRTLGRVRTTLARISDRVRPPTPDG